MSSEDINFYATSIVGLISAFSFYKVCSSQSRVSDKKKLIKTISQTPIKSPDDAFSPGEQVIIKGTAQRNDKDSRNDKIVRKNVSTGKMDDYVLYVNYREAIYSNENFSNKEQYVVVLNQVLGRADVSFNPSFLINGIRKNVIVSNYDQADYSRILDITRWDNKKRRLTFTEKLEVFMLSYFRAVGTLVISDKGRPGYLRGIDIGTREVQTGVKVGASIMALGTIGVGLDGQVSIEPNLLFKDRLSVLTSLNEIVTGDQNSRNFWFVVLILGSLYIGRRVYNYNKKHNLVDKIKNWWNKQK